MKKIRAFIAIPLPENVKELLAGVSNQWADKIPAGSVRWVKPQLMHITLRFLGDTKADTIPDLAAKMDEISVRREAFALNLSQPGCFPNTKRPRVVWVGLQGQLDAAEALKKEIDQLLVPLGWEMENRPFRPHLTIGRVKDSRKVQDFRWESEIEPLPVPVQMIQLIESKLQRTGPIYTVRHESRLVG